MSQSVYAPFSRKWFEMKRGVGVSLVSSAPIPTSRTLGCQAKYWDHDGDRPSWQEEEPEEWMLWSPLRATDDSVSESSMTTDDDDMVVDKEMTHLGHMVRGVSEDARSALFSYRIVVFRHHQFCYPRVGWWSEEML